MIETIICCILVSLMFGYIAYLKGKIDLNVDKYIDEESEDESGKKYE